MFKSKSPGDPRTGETYGINSGHWLCNERSPPPRSGRHRQTVQPVHPQAQLLPPITLQAGYDIRTVQELLGHRVRTTTILHARHEQVARGLSLPDQL